MRGFVLGACAAILMVGCQQQAPPPHKVPPAEVEVGGPQGGVHVDDPAGGTKVDVDGSGVHVKTPQSKVDVP